MARFGLVLAVIGVALTIFTLVDIGLTDPRRVRGVPKPVWFLIALLPIVGLILWFAVGRGPAPQSDRMKTIAPDDDPSFLRNLRRDEEQDERIRRLEQELADLDDDPPADK